MDFKELNDKLNAWLNEFIDSLKNLPTDEKISYSAVACGVVFIIIGAVVW